MGQHDNHGGQNVCVVELPSKSIGHSDIFRWGPDDDFVKDSGRASWPPHRQEKRIRTDRLPKGNLLHLFYFCYIYFCLHLIYLHNLLHLLNNFKDFHMKNSRNFSSKNGKVSFILTYISLVTNF